MAQGDLNVANQSGAAFRADLNNQLAALGTLQSGASAPSTTFAYMLWADTTAGILKLRNAANSAWINVGTLASTNLGLALAASPTFTGTATFTGDITMSGTGFLDVPVGTTAQRPASPTSGMVRFNTTTAQFEGYGTAAWSQLGNTALSGKNRIINGDMRIDQRGATATINSSALTYAVDRWAGFGIASAGVFTLARSTTAPSNFTNSLAASCTTADASLASTDRYFISQPVEGNNTADLGFGTATAKTLTVSFWVQSSLTGTYCVALANGDANRSYVTEYSINAANTWEYKTITIAGDTAGTWLTDTSIGVSLRFALAAGTTFQTTANNWAGGNFIATANQVNWMSSNTSRTFRVTGVQIETGTVATPFELRSYGEELTLCQRYYYKTDKGFSLQSYGISAGENTYAHLSHPVPMRAAPTASATFAGGVNNQSQTVTPSAQSFTVQLISNGGGSYAITYSVGNTFTAEM
jgi:hypothetical protein